MRVLVLLMVLVGVAGAAPGKEPGSLVLVLDRSGSMQGPRLEAAKRAVIAAAGALGPRAQIAVVAFDSEAQVYVRPQRVGDGKRIAEQMARLVAGGGTNVTPALKEARDMLHDMPGPRHVLVITDGEAPTEGLREVLWDLVDESATVSAIGLGQDADRDLVALIAEEGDGRLYMVEDPAALERVVIGDLAARMGVTIAAPHARKALVLMLDRSGSLSADAFRDEKHAAIAAVRTLAPADQIGVIAFDSEAAVWVPLAPVGDASHVIEQIAALKQQGGTNLYAPLAAARALRAAVPMQFVMITDGDGHPDGVAEAALALDNLSVVGIHPADRQLLAAIAGRGGGRVYFVDDSMLLADELRAAIE